MRLAIRCSPAGIAEGPSDTAIVTALAGGRKRPPGRSGDDR